MKSESTRRVFIQTAAVSAAGIAVAGTAPHGQHEQHKANDAVQTIQPANDEFPRTKLVLA